MTLLDYCQTDAQRRNVEAVDELGSFSAAAKAIGIGRKNSVGFVSPWRNDWICNSIIRNCIDREPLVGTISAGGLQGCRTSNAKTNRISVRNSNG